MKTVFITGGAGFVGSHLVRRLLATPGVEFVIVYDNLSSGSREALPDDPRLTFIKGNVRDLDTLRMAMGRDVDTVFHLAANPDIAKAATEPTIDFEQGTVLTNNVLESIRRNGVRRLVYFSGSGVYGDCAETVLREDHPIAPISTYGASKAASEAMIHAYCAMFGLTAIVLRPANIVGPRQTHGVGYAFLRKLKADHTRLEILGDGNQLKSYIHVDDVINAVLSLKFGSVGTFNVATDDGITVTEIAQMAVLVSGRSTGSVRFDYMGGRGGWKGDVPVVRMDCERLRAIGWKPQYTARDAVWLSLLAMREELDSKA